MNAMLLVFVALLAAPADDPGPGSAGPFGDRIFSALDAERLECLRGVLRKFDDAAEMHCGFPDIKGKHFVRRWQSAFPDDLASDDVVVLSDWVETLGGWYRRYYEVEGIPTVVAYGGRQPGLVVAHFKRYPECAEADDRLPRVGRDVPEVERIREAWVDAVYPEQARTRRLDGVVLLRIVIGDDGTTRDVCVLDAAPRGYGFEDSAVEAFRQFRYEPVVQDGRPVSVQRSTVKVFDYQ